MIDGTPRRRSFFRWLKSTPNRTFIVYPISLVAVEYIIQGQTLNVRPLGAILMVWGIAQFTLVRPYRFKRGGGGPGIEAAGAESLGAGQVATLGRDIIHSVANPITKLTSAIHVYGGDFFNPPEPRSQWGHESLVEQPWNIDDVRAVFSQAEIRYNAGLAAGLDA